MTTTYKYDHYFLYQEYETVLKSFADKYPNLLTLEVLVTSKQQRNLYAVTLTKNNTDPLNKPAMYIDGNTHAGELTGYMAAVYFIDYVLTNQNQADISQMLEDYTIYVIPKIAVDGSEAYMTTPYSYRSSNLEYLYQHQGLYEKDIDNDGVIRMMRIKDPNGKFVKTDDDFNMRIRKPDEVVGEFYSLYIEGEVENDSLENFLMPINKYKLDFNRNYPFGWFNNSRQAGAGDYPLSNYETKAVVDFVLAHPNINVAATNHTCGGVLLCPPGTYSEKAAFKNDMQVYHEIGEMATEAMDYPVINIFDSYMTDQKAFDSGAFDDFLYENLGIYTYTIEFWDVWKAIGKPIDWKNIPKPSLKRDLEVLAALTLWTKENYQDDFKPWTKVEHPQFKDCEVGGVNYKYIFQNPPVALLEKELSNATNFYLRYVKTAAKLQVSKLVSKQVAPGVYEIKMQLSNQGYLPTYLSEACKKAKLVKPIKVELNLEKEAILSGKQQSEIANLEGYSTTNAGMYTYARVITAQPSNQTTTLTWLIKGQPKQKISITINSLKAGSIKANIVL